MYVPAGYVASPQLMNLIDEPDVQARRRAVAGAVRPIADTWLVPADTMNWMMKQIARLKRLEAEGRLE